MKDEFRPPREDEAFNDYISSLMAHHIEDSWESFFTDLYREPEPAPEPEPNFIEKTLPGGMIIIVPDTVIENGRIQEGERLDGFEYYETHDLPAIESGGKVIEGEVLGE